VARFSTISLAEARTAVLPPRRALQEQYRQYIRQLTPDAAGRIELSFDDRSITERARLKAAAKAEGASLEIHRKGNTMVFWKAAEAPKSTGRATRRAPRGR